LLLKHAAFAFLIMSHVSSKRKTWYLHYSVWIQNKWYRKNIPVWYFTSIYMYSVNIEM